MFQQPPAPPRRNARTALPQEVVLAPPRSDVIYQGSLRAEHLGNFMGGGPFRSF